MSLASNLALLAGVAAAGVIGIALLKAKLGRGHAEDAPKFKAKALLTPNELEFLGRLEAAAPELRFHSQVSMGALLDPAVSRKDGQAYFRARGMFSQKIVDYVAQRRSDGAIVAVIELDDRTHERGKDVKRDAMLTGAGYTTVRWTASAKPSAEAIRAKLMAAAPPREEVSPATPNRPFAVAGTRRSP